MAISFGNCVIFQTTDEDSDYYNKKKWVHTLYVFNQTYGVGNQKYYRNETGF